MRSNIHPYIKKNTDGSRFQKLIFYFILLRIEWWKKLRGTATSFEIKINMLYIHKTHLGWQWADSSRVSSGLWSSCISNWASRVSWVQFSIGLNSVCCLFRTAQSALRFVRAIFFLKSGLVWCLSERPLR